jgi:hypothetical protein
MYEAGVPFKLCLIVGEVSEDSEVLPATVWLSKYRETRTPGTNPYSFSFFCWAIETSQTSPTSPRRSVYFFYPDAMGCENLTNFTNLTARSVYVLYPDAMDCGNLTNFTNLTALRREYCSWATAGRQGTKNHPGALNR